MKIMLAKAIGLHGATIKDMFTATSLASTRNSARLDKLEVSLNSLTEELKMHSKRLDGFIQMFQLYLRHVLNVSIEMPEDDSQTTIIRLHKSCLIPKGVDATSPSAAGHSGASNPVM